ncbi:hypothetical protein [uncultured Acetatifactor sp.]|uniref:hypothetical protein n=1 Tax=uncultured Acetatifactor sp. TaxID=1671927 RepID=UPI00263408A5|nr:hypothetical protein [uncultured Acetatifactor sp.]
MEWMKLRLSAYLWAIAGMVSCLVAMMYATAHLFRIEPRMAPGNLNLVMCGLGLSWPGLPGLPVGPVRFWQAELMRWRFRE